MRSNEVHIRKFGDEHLKDQKDRKTEDFSQMTNTCLFFHRFYGILLILFPNIPPLIFTLNHMLFL